MYAIVVELSSIRRLPAPPISYPRFVPVTSQSLTATENSVRVKWFHCRSAAHVHRIFRTFVIVTVCEFVSVRSLKSRSTRHFVGETPPVNSADEGDHDSVPAPYTPPYTPILFPFAPTAPVYVRVIEVPLATAVTSPASPSPLINPASSETALA